MRWRIADLTRDAPAHIEQAALLLHDAFRGRSDEWQDIESARQEVLESLASDRVSLIALDASGSVIGWIGGQPTYRGRVWELHPLVVARTHRRQGVGSALVRGLERVVGGRGAITLWLGSDDENGETTLSGVDVYGDVPEAIRGVRTLRGEHPCEFYLRTGFQVTGVVPDANGIGKPDILFAKRVSTEDDS